MRFTSLGSISLAIFWAVGCGARTGEDELRLADLSSVGGLPAGGGTGSGSAAGAGGLGTGGAPSGGGGVGAGGVATGGGAGACCSASAGRGCPADPGIEACVCSEDPFCCTGAWDSTCVAVIEEFGCGTCNVGTGGTAGAGGALPVGDCCEVQAGTGCSEPGLASCVCAADEYCCSTRWDATCVAGVAACGGDCRQGSGGSPSTGGAPNSGGGAGAGGGGGGSSNCCVVHGSPGCDSAGVEECVCGIDDFCCLVGWDSLCVERVTQTCAPTLCGVGGVGGAGGQASGGGGTDAGGAGGLTMGTGGQIGVGGQMGTGGSSYCDYLPAGGCEECVCNACYDPLIACLEDEGCTCIATSGCTGLADCLSDDNCGPVLRGGNGLASLARAIELASCQSGSDCPCF